MKHLTQYGVWILISIGIALRLWEFFLIRTFSWDEASLALAVNSHGISQLGHLYFGPLRLFHPIGFLVLTKLLLLTPFVSSSELSYRLLPFIASIASLALFYLLAKQLLTKPFQLLALFLFVFSSQQIYYSAVFREYTIDILVSIVLYLLFFLFVIKNQLTRKNAVLLSLAGAVASLVSLPSYFLLPTLACVGFLTLKKKKLFLIPVAVWLGALAVNYFFVLRIITKQDVLFSDFSGYFVPHVFSSVVLRWVWFQCVSLFTFQITEWYFIPLVLFVVGLFGFVRSNRKMLVLFCLPLIFAFGASFLKAYPITGRHMLFIAPFIFVTVAYGAQYLWQRKIMQKFGRIVVIFLIASLLIGQVWQYISFETHFTDEQDNLQPLMQILSDKNEAGDSVLLYNNTDAAYLFYAPRFELSYMPTLRMRYRTNEFPLYIQDLQQLIGKKRVWVLFTHDYNWGRADEEEYLVGYMNQIGKQLDDITLGTSDLYLYDFSKK